VNLQELLKRGVVQWFMPVILTILKVAIKRIVV
jgi:hypothetical protein